MNENRQRTSRPQPYRMRLPGFISDEDVGSATSKTSHNHLLGSSPVAAANAALPCQPARRHWASEIIESLNSFLRRSAMERSDTTNNRQARQQPDPAFL